MNYLYELFVFELSTHLCTVNVIVFGMPAHTKIFISSKPDGLFQCAGFNYLPSGKNPYHSGINYLYHGIPLITVFTGDFDLEFEFER
jgi:hypothetical protein